MTLQAGDDIVLGAESFHDDGEHIRLKEMVLQKNHPWIGQRIQELAGDLQFLDALSDPGMVFLQDHLLKPDLSLIHI